MESEIHVHQAVTVSSQSLETVFGRLLLISHCPKIQATLEDSLITKRRVGIETTSKRLSTTNQI